MASYKHKYQDITMCIPRCFIMTARHTKWVISCSSTNTSSWRVHLLLSMKLENIIPTTTAVSFSWTRRIAFLSELLFLLIITWIRVRAILAHSCCILQHIDPSCPETERIVLNVCSGDILVIYQGFYVPDKLLSHWLQIFLIRCRLSARSCKRKKLADHCWVL